jgi:YbgC/YbaW family acyl-CoA thioester hydrolase
MALADFRYIMRLTVPYHDIDMLQHVNHAAYIVWAETARVGYFQEVVGEHLAGNNGIILARLEFDYQRPLSLGDKVAVGCRTLRLGRRSLDLVYEIWNEPSSSQAAHGLTTLVAYDYEARKSRSIPEPWREAVVAYETVAPILRGAAGSRT